jgi:hypothetical protein
MIEKERDPEAAAAEEDDRKDEFQELTEMFNSAELDTVRRYGGRMHKDYVDDTDMESISGGRRRVLIKDSTQEVLEKHVRGGPDMAPAIRERINGKLQGIYQNVSLSFFAASQRRTLADERNSTSSSAPPRPSAFSSPPPPSASRESCSRPSSTESAAPIAYAPISAPPSAKAAASRPRSAGSPARTKTAKARAVRDGSTARLSSGTPALWAFGWSS